MKRTLWQQETRLMRFEEACEGWTERRPSNGILFKEIHTFTNFIEWQLIDSRDINIYFKKSIKNLLTNACAFPIILCIALCSLGQ